MTRYGLFMGLLTLALATGTGCGLRRCLVPCCGGANGGHCGAASCGSCCGVANDPILGDCNKCGVCGGGNCPGFTPCGYLKYMLTCGSACGGHLYYGEWIENPPDCCDPCDSCGNWTGPVCCARRRPVGGALREICWGNRYPGSCCGSSCGAGGCTGPGYSPNYNGAPGDHIGAPGERIEHVGQSPPVGETGRSFNEARPANPTPALLPRRAAPEPKASRPTNTSRVSYQRPGVPMRPGSYRANPAAYGRENPPQYRGENPQQYRGENPSAMRDYPLER